MNKLKKSLMLVILGTMVSTPLFAEVNQNLYRIGFRIYKTNVWIKTRHRLNRILTKTIFNNDDYDGPDLETGNDFVKWITNPKGEQEFLDLLKNYGYGKDAKYIEKLLQSKNPLKRKAVLEFLKDVFDGYVPPSCM